jgi:lipopolysaccharide export system protein LptA
MLDKNVKLYTDSLNYDMMRNTAYYYGGGKIVDSTSTLTSSLGHYFTNSEIFFFKDSVVVTNDNYTMYTDTLEYHSKSNRAIFKGPTTILNDTNRLYAERGWYDTQKDLGRIHQKASYTNENQTLDCDTLFYNRNAKYGEAFGNVIIKSLKDSITLTSNYAYYNEAEESSLATDSATLIQVSTSDTTYLHADTLLSYVDSIDGDIRNVYAYYKAQLFSDNIQMRSDSIAFSFKDSIVRLFGHPVIWTDSSQMKADIINFRIVKNELTDVYLKENAIIIEEKDSVHYNQIKGFEITGHLKEHELKKAFVNRRSETIYYLEEEGELNSMNKTRCRQMIVYFKEGRPNQIVWISEPEGQVLPMKDLNEGNMYFNDFEWLDHLRPKKLEDIYIWKPYTPKR